MTEMSIVSEFLDRILSNFIYFLKCSHFFPLFFMADMLSFGLKVSIFFLHIQNEQIFNLIKSKNTMLTCKHSAFLFQEQEGMGQRKKVIPQNSYLPCWLQSFLPCSGQLQCRFPQRWAASCQTLEDVEVLAHQTDHNRKAPAGWAKKKKKG